MMSNDEQQFNHLYKYINRTADEARLVLAERIDPRHKDFSGVQLMIQEIQVRRIHLVFKMKVICPDGYHNQTFVALGGTDRAMPAEDCKGSFDGMALYFEGVCLKNGHGVKEFLHVRGQCNRVVFDPPRKHGVCTLCTPCSKPCKILLDEAKRKFLEKFSSVSTAILTLTEAQMMQDNSNTPVGEKEDPSSVFYIEHTHVNALKAAQNKERFIDTPPMETYKGRFIDN